MDTADILLLLFVIACPLIMLLVHRAGSRSHGQEHGHGQGGCGHLGHHGGQDQPGAAGWDASVDDLRRERDRLGRRLEELNQRIEELEREAQRPSRPA